jgi:SAM-dependent methyltransferase
VTRLENFLPVALRQDTPDKTSKPLMGVIRMDNSTKIQAILLPEKRGDNQPARTHYLSEEKTTWWNPQRFFQRFPRLYSWIKAILSPTFSLHSWKQVVPDPSNHLVIDLGAGTNRLHPNIINVDFVKFPNIDIVASFADSLPIQSECIDAVVSISVFEHLEKPAFVVSEVKRILKPGGLFYLATPFQYPFHAAPDDFQRWTLPGLRVLLGDHFKVIAWGGRGGPMGVIILSVSHCLAQICSFGSHQLYSIVNFASMGLLGPLKLLDLIFARLPFNTTLCPGLYVVAQKI